MKLELSPATGADIPSFPPVQIASFTDELSLTLFPRGPSIAPWIISKSTDFLSNPDYATVVVKDLDLDIVVGYAQWERPKGVDLKAALAGLTLPIWPEGCDKEFNDTFTTELARLRAESMGDRPHWYIKIVAVHPDYQGRGVGSLLLRWGLAQADAAEIETYLEATPRGLPVYINMGFVPLIKVLRFENTHATTCMLRPRPGKKIEVI